MIIANMIVIVAILGCAVYLYLKGTLVKSAIMLVTILCGLIPAFAYYEALANMLISRGKLVEWAQPLCFGLLFIVAFAILQTIVDQLIKRPIAMPVLVDQIGRAVCGIFLGFLASGIVLTTMAMAPLAAKFPYRRFEAVNPNAENPKRVLLNADGFVTGLFAHVSSGSLSGKRSFAAVHPALVDELMLNRLKDPKAVFAKGNPMSTPAKNGVWPAPGVLKDTEGDPVGERSGYTLMFVRTDVSASALRDGGLDLVQLRLICTNRSLTGDRLEGKGKNVYVFGYRTGAGEVKRVRLSDKLEVGGSQKKTFDLAFYVPDTLLPAAIAYRQNFMTSVSLPASGEPIPEAPESEPVEDSEAAPEESGNQPQNNTSETIE